MERNNDVSTTSKKVFTKTVILAGCVLVLILMLQIPFHHIESGFTEKVFYEIDRLEGVYIEKQVAQTDFITAVDNFYGIHLVQWDGDGVQITQERSVFKDRVILYITLFVAIFLVAILSYRMRKSDRKRIE